MPLPGLPPGMGAPGMGGPPPMAGMGMPGMGPSPLGGAPQAALQALDSMSQAPPGVGEKDAIQKATSEIQVALSRVMLRSPKAAKMLADALGKLQSALVTLEQEHAQPVGPPPDLLGALMGGMPMGAPGGVPSASPF